MTAPRPDSDDPWGGELAEWIANGYGVPEPPRRTTPVFDIKDTCMCDHRFGDHVKYEPDRPVRCAHTMCGCIRFRYRSPTEDDHNNRMDRMRDCADLDFGADYDPEED